MSRTDTIYVLHFEPAYRAPIGDTGRFKTAGHYLGSCLGTPHRRLEEHLAGAGSPLVRAAVAAGCKVTLAAAFPGGRQLERQLKRRHHHARLCTVCNPPPPRQEEA